MGYAIIDISTGRTVEETAGSVINPVHYKKSEDSGSDLELPELEERINDKKDEIVIIDQIQSKTDATLN